jgi:hypothetical protein
VKEDRPVTWSHIWRHCLAGIGARHFVIAEHDDLPVLSNVLLERAHQVRQPAIDETDVGLEPPCDRWPLPAGRVVS